LRIALEMTTCDFSFKVNTVSMSIPKIGYLGYNIEFGIQRQTFGKWPITRKIPKWNVGFVFE
jgi:hypothetical protein